MAACNANDVRAVHFNAPCSYSSNSRFEIYAAHAIHTQPKNQQQPNEFWCVVYFVLVKLCRSMSATIVCVTKYGWVCGIVLDDWTVVSKYRDDNCVEHGEWSHEQCVNEQVWRPTTTTTTPPPPNSLSHELKWSVRVFRMVYSKIMCTAMCMLEARLSFWTPGKTERIEDTRTRARYS